MPKSEKKQEDKVYVKVIGVHRFSPKVSVISQHEVSGKEFSVTIPVDDQFRQIAVIGKYGAEPRGLNSKVLKALRRKNKWRQEGWFADYEGEEKK